LEQIFHAILESLWAPATYAKFAFIGVTAPFWWPLAKVMYHEILPALNAPGDAVTRRAPGEDPFLNIPLATYRAQRDAARGTRSAGGTRRRGF